VTTRGDERDAGNPGADAVVHHTLDRGCRYGNHGEIDRRRDVGDGGVARDPRDCAGVRVDLMDAPVETGQQIPQHAGTDAPGAARADDGDGPWCEARSQAGQSGRGWSGGADAHGALTSR
jgi:hypothetical protein